MQLQRYMINSNNDRKNELTELLCVQVNHHTVRMHTAFIKARDSDNFEHWEDSWKKCDVDKDGLVPLHVSLAFRVYAMVALRVVIADRGENIQGALQRLSHRKAQRPGCRISFFA